MPSRHIRGHHSSMGNLNKSWGTWVSRRVQIFWNSCSANMTSKNRWWPSILEWPTKARFSSVIPALKIIWKLAATCNLFRSFPTLINGKSTLIRWTWLNPRASCNRKRFWRSTQVSTTSLYQWKCMINWKHRWLITTTLISRPSPKTRSNAIKTLNRLCQTWNCSSKTMQVRLLNSSWFGRTTYGS